MTLDPREVEYKKNVGKIGNNPLIEVGLKGGLHLIFMATGGRFETMGAGPHRAVARFIAGKKAKALDGGKAVWTDLNKADHIEPAYFEHLLPKYEAMTDAFRSAQGL
jgi:hypothetical protein